MRATAWATQWATKSNKAQAPIKTQQPPAGEDDRDTVWSARRGVWRVVVAIVAFPARVGEPVGARHSDVEGALAKIHAVDPGAPAEARETSKKEKSWDYDKEIKNLQVELAHLQAWVKKSGARIVIVFEGRDAAGNGGMIKRITEKVSPRVFRVAALPAPTDREKSQIYVLPCPHACRR